MSFGDFVIHYEHKFLRNIYTDEQLKIHTTWKILKVITKYLKNTL